MKNCPGSGVFLTAVTAGEMAGGCLRMLLPRLDIWESRLFLHGIGICGGDAGAVRCHILLFSLLWMTAFFVLGMMVAARVTSLLLLFLHGMALGSELAILYSGQVWTGLLTAILFVMPYALGQTGIWLVSAREAWRSPSLKYSCTGRGEAGETSLRIYLLRFAVLAIGMAVLSGVQGLVMGSVYPAVLHKLAGN